LRMVAVNALPFTLLAPSPWRRAKRGALVCALQLCGLRSRIMLPGFGLPRTRSAPWRGSAAHSCDIAATPPAYALAPCRICWRQHLYSAGAGVSSRFLVLGSFCALPGSTHRTFSFHGFGFSAVWFTSRVAFVRVVGSGTAFSLPFACCLSHYCTSTVPLPTHLVLRLSPFTYSSLFFFFFFFLHFQFLPLQLHYCLKFLFSLPLGAFLSRFPFGCAVLRTSAHRFCCARVFRCLPRVLSRTVPLGSPRGCACRTCLAPRFQNAAHPRVHGFVLHFPSAPPQVVFTPRHLFSPWFVCARMRARAAFAHWVQVLYTRVWTITACCLHCVRVFLPQVQVPAAWRRQLKQQRVSASAARALRIERAARSVQ